MIALVGVEARRFLARPVVRWMAAILLLGLLAGGLSVFVKSNRDIAGATAAKRIEATKEYDRCVGEAGGKAAALCEAPKLDEIVAEPRFHLTQITDILVHQTALLIVLGLVAGASFVGADWHHRTITTTLTWEPRRARVLAGKILAASAVVFVSTVGFQVLLAGALTPAAVYRGTTAGATGGWLADLIEGILRSGVVAALAASIGISLAMIGRNTAAALAAMFVWVAIAENAIRASFPGWRRWLVVDNAGAFVGVEPPHVRSSLTAGLLVLAYAAFAAVVAGAVFRRRDVA